MRSFIVLCLVAVACADKLGYNYHPVDHADAGLSFAPGGSYGASSNTVPSYAPQGEVAEASHDTPSYTTQAYAPQGEVAEASHDTASYTPQAEYEKEFYSFNANDEDFNDGDASNQVAHAVKQGLRVVFIKGPENRGLEEAALALAKQAANQQSAIYVLNKQADLSGLADKLNALNKNNNNKPDVHFVKYRTPEDAANAQRAIQDQYNSLGGSSQSHNGGVAPVLNFASSAPSHAAPAHAASAPGASYLPASIFRL